MQVMQHETSSLNDSISTRSWYVINYDDRITKIIEQERPEICLVEQNRTTNSFLARYLNNFFCLILTFVEGELEPKVMGQTL
jgi:hypothetical protein